MSSPTPLSYSAEQVRRFDRDRFGTALFAPSDRREALFALYAFNVEVAQIRELVREPLLGRIRLQWWRDALQDLRMGKTVAHPVAAALTAVSLSNEPFEELLSAREQDMDPAPPDDLATLNAYAAGTGGAINVLAMEILGVHEGEALAAARSVGTAWALTGLLRAVPFHAAAGRLYLPASLLAEHNLSVGDIMAGRNGPQLTVVAKIIADIAQGYLDEARCQCRRPPKTALSALLSASLAERYLDALARNGFNLFDPNWSVPRPRPVSLGWKMFRGRF